MLTAPTAGAATGTRCSREVHRRVVAARAHDRRASAAGHRVRPSGDGAMRGDDPGAVALVRGAHGFGERASRVAPDGKTAAAARGTRAGARRRFGVVALR